MKSISVSNLVALMKTRKTNLGHLSLNGDLLNWDVLENFENSNRTLILIEIADENNIVHVLIKNPKSGRSPSDYFIAFANAGINVKLKGAFKIPPADIIIMKKNLNPIIMSYASKLADIEIRGCPSYKNWILPHSQQAANKNLSLSTAAEIYLKEEKTQLFKKKPWPQWQKTRPSSSNHFFDKTNSDSYSEFKNSDQGFDYSIKSVDIPDKFPAEKFKWFFTEKGAKIFSFPLKDTFFKSKINYTRPRLSFVFQFNPPNRGLVAIYWMSKELKWNRIGEIKTEKKDDYLILKHFINEIDSIEDFQTKLNLKDVIKVNSLPELEID